MPPKHKKHKKETTSDSAAPPIYAVPGPTLVHTNTLDIYRGHYLSSDLEDACFSEYAQVQHRLEKIFGYEYQHDAKVPDRTVVMSGEAMVALWAGLKSLILPGKTRVLAVANGLYGEGIGEMAKQCGAEVSFVKVEWDQAISVEAVRTAAKQYKPQLVTFVHSDTPCGNLNTCLPEIGKVALEVGALLYVDFVSSGLSVPIDVTDAHIDIGLLGSQKVLGLLPDLGVLTVSAKAWGRIEQVDYKGYDALLTWKHAVHNKYFPYTHNWRAIRALGQRLQEIQDEGLTEFYNRHTKAMEYVRKRMTDIGLELLIKSADCASRSCTTVCLPAWLNSSDLDQCLRRLPSGPVYVGDNYGKLKGNTFRVGHMGAMQTDLILLKKVCDGIETAFSQLTQQRHQ
eukprot:gb/GEZN01008039.1/.p1 GENE.gb/GEZN01008039.1/~~gb/GEZN01008039.1/.p1  ORF type:complete len:397 (-),score=40.93 gb/GEZN01008039.1/:250-1440(-)